MSGLDALSAFADRHGIHPVAFAVALVSGDLNAHEHVKAGRAINPESFPGYDLELTTDALARRIVGTLLDAGWTPPGELLPQQPEDFAAPQPPSDPS